ncbi:MAG: YqgE/AlgH family protein [Actinomycetes bacterium]
MGQVSGRSGDGVEPPLTGSLLVATPALVGPEFEQTVVLVLEHDPDSGALGVVLNRPLPVPVGAELPAWAASSVVAEPAVVFSGGPVEDDTVLLVALAQPGAAPQELRPVTGRVAVVPFTVPADEAYLWSDGVRVFAGYAGWAPGQLEAEVDGGFWYIVDSEPGDLVDAEPARLWRSVLRRQRGVLAPLALMATWTADPELN